MLRLSVLSLLLVALTATLAVAPNSKVGSRQKRQVKFLQLNNVGNQLGRTGTMRRVAFRRNAGGPVLLVSKGRSTLNQVGALSNRASLVQTGPQIVSPPLSLTGAQLVSTSSAALQKSLLILENNVFQMSAKLEILEELFDDFVLQPVCPDMFPLQRGLSCYSVSVEALNFDAAKAACEAQGGKLAEIETAGENEFLKLYARLDGKVAYWIGGSDTALEGTFVWVSDNRAITFFDWATNGQPDNNGGVEDCVEIRVVAPFDSRWNDRACSIQNRYICETSLIPAGIDLDLF